MEKMNRSRPLALIALLVGALIAPAIASAATAAPTATVSTASTSPSAIASGPSGVGPETRVRGFELGNGARVDGDRGADREGVWGIGEPPRGTASGCLLATRGTATVGTTAAEGASSGWTRVSRWMSPKEAELWRGRSSIPQPSSTSGLPPRTYVTGEGVPRPGGTSGVRVDFEVPTHALEATQSGWFQIWNQFRSIPIREVKVVNP
jgi:hypothetical protein